MAKHRMLKGVLRIIPREQLNQIAKEFTAQDRPWNSQRKDLELMIVSAAMNNKEANNEIAADLIGFLTKRLTDYS